MTVSLRIDVVAIQRIDEIAKRVGMSRNAMLCEAVESYLKNYRRLEIDEAFAEMATDAQYQKEAVQICREFEHADWEAR